MKRLILALILFFCGLWRMWWLLNERLLGIEMDNEDFSRWIHNDLKGIHDHLDEDVVAEKIPEPTQTVNQLQGYEWKENETAIEHTVGNGFSWKCMRCGKPVYTKDNELPQYCGNCGREVISAVIGENGFIAGEIKWSDKEEA